MDNRIKQKRYFDLKYAYMHLMEQDVILQRVTQGTKIGSTGGVRTESSMPIHFIKMAERMASEGDMSEFEKALKTIYDKHPLVKERVGTKTEGPSVDLSAELVSGGEYHFVLEMLIDSDLRPMLDKEIVADNYYLVMENNSIVGAFTTSKTGELKGLFSLRKGYGKDIFKLRLEKAEEDVNDNITHLTLFCFKTDKLLKLYESFGFVISNEYEWNEEYRPSDWNEKKFGKPNVVDMVKEIR